MMNYIALIRKEPKSDFGVEFPDFPGCITAGSSIDDAKELAQEALQAHVEFMLEDKEELPEPSSLDKIMKSKKNRQAVAFIVALSLKPKSIRFNATIDKNLLSAIDSKAKSLGKTRSSFLADAARNELQHYK
jgi:predicted RNase H-like HicB family nuclease